MLVTVSLECLGTLTEIPILRSRTGMLIPAQLRAARALVDWSREQLAEKSGTSAYTIKGFEARGTDAKQGTVHRWRRALEAVGVEFTDQTDIVGPGVRFRKPVAEAK
jgi:transcriptional regulator with XRE-family HTH domain